MSLGLPVRVDTAGDGRGGLLKTILYGEAPPRGPTRNLLHIDVLFARHAILFNVGKERVMKAKERLRKRLGFWSFVFFR